MTVRGIERAIETPSSAEADEIRDWLVLRKAPQPIDSLIEEGIPEGRFDGLVAEGLEDERDGRLEPMRPPGKEAGKPIGPPMNADERR